MAYEGDNDLITHKSVFGCAGAAIGFGILLILNVLIGGSWPLLKIILGALLIAGGALGFARYLRNL
jgi:hypothetical protein